MKNLLAVCLFCWTGLLARVWQTENYVGCQASSRVYCGKLKVVFKDTIPYNLDDIVIIGFLYNPDNKKKLLVRKGYCVLRDFPVNGIVFDCPSYKNNVYYRIYFFLKDPKSRYKKALPTTDIIEKIQEGTEQICSEGKLAYEPLNLHVQVTQGEKIALGVIVLLTLGAVVGTAWLDQQVKNVERKVNKLRKSIHNFKDQIMGDNEELRTRIDEMSQDLLNLQIQLRILQDEQHRRLVDEKQAEKNKK